MRAYRAKYCVLLRGGAGCLCRLRARGRGRRLRTAEKSAGRGEAVFPRRTLPTVFSKRKGHIEIQARRGVHIERETRLELWMGKSHHVIHSNSVKGDLAAHVTPAD